MKTLLGVLLIGSSVFATEIISESASLRSNCRVTRTGEHRVFGSRCYKSDEVMTGFTIGDPPYVYCAKIQVDCSRSDSNATEKKEADEN